MPRKYFVFSANGSIFDAVKSAKSRCLTMYSPQGFRRGRVSQPNVDAILSGRWLTVGVPLPRAPALAVSLRWRLMASREGRLLYYMAALPMAAVSFRKRLIAPVCAILFIACALLASGRALASEIAAPDYSRPDYWTPVTAMPQGVTQVLAGQAVDVFWVHPTTTRSATDFNHDPLEPAGLKWTDESAVQRQASAFAACCRIFAPRYRAATTKAVFDPVMRDTAFALAYGDVERAFDWYLAHENKGRPFILAGHSQGAAHVASLLEKRIRGTALQRQMVAAYVIGINLLAGDLDTRFAGIPVCTRPAQTGCMLQWNSLLAGSDPEPVLAAYGKAYAAAHNGASGGEPLCINPVTFDARRPLALSAEAKGAVPGAPGLGAMQALRKGAVAVECRRGIAVVWPAPGLGLEPLPGGSMHFHDVGLFWADIRANAVLRAQAWHKVRRK